MKSRIELSKEKENNYTVKIITPRLGSKDIHNSNSELEIIEDSITHECLSNISMNEIINSYIEKYPDILVSCK